MFGADLLHLDSFLNKLWINKLVLASPHIIAYKTTAETATKTSKKAKDLFSKTTTLYMHHAFLSISLPSLHKYDVKWPNFKSS